MGGFLPLVRLGMVRCCDSHIGLYRPFDANVGSYRTRLPLQTGAPGFPLGLGSRLIRQSTSSGGFRMLSIKKCMTPWWIARAIDDGSQLKIHVDLGRSFQSASHPLRRFECVGSCCAAIHLFGRQRRKVNTIENSESQSGQQISEISRVQTRLLNLHRPSHLRHDRASPRVQ